MMIFCAKRKYVGTLLFLSFIVTSFAQPSSPGNIQQKSILLLGGTVHIGNGTVIKDAAIGLEHGVITLVADQLVTSLDTTLWDTIIHTEGTQIYPGFIAPNSTLGLEEIGAVRASKDKTEVGTFNPEVRSIVAYNTDSDITPTVRTNGVLLAQITPRGGRISGTSSVVQLDAWNWEDAVVKIDDGVHLNWPSYYKNTHRYSEKSTVVKSDTYDKQEVQVYAFFTKAQAYSLQKNHEEVDIKMEALVGIFSGTKKLYIHANFAKEIVNMCNFTKTLGITNVVLVGGSEAYRVIPLLKERQISVMIPRLHQLPENSDADIDLVYKMPFLLQQGGILFCIQNAGYMEQMNARNIPFLAGTAVAYGLTEEEAISAISLNSAKILGIDKHLGSIEEGKDATLFISSGDALDMMTNNVIYAWIQGRKVNLINRQYKLYNKFSEKYSQTSN